MANPTTNPTIGQLAADLAAGRTTSRTLTEEALDRIGDAKGEGKRAFIKVYKTQALAAADAALYEAKKAGRDRIVVAKMPERQSDEKKTSGASA